MPTKNSSETSTTNKQDISPVYIKNYRLPYTQRKEKDKQVSKLLENNLIEASKSSYNRPIILAPQKGKTMCIDYIVNKKLIFPLEIII